jgi:hypothetical protein
LPRLECDRAVEVNAVRVASRRVFASIEECAGALISDPSELGHELKRLLDCTREVIGELS